MRTFVSIISSFAMLALFSPHCEAGEIFNCIQNSLHAEAASGDGDLHTAEVYFYVHHAKFKFHPNLAIQDQAFRLFSENDSPWTVIDQFFSKDPVVLKRAFEKLEALPELTRAEILQDPEQTETFFTQNFPPKTSIGIRSPVEYNGVTYEKQSLHNALDIKRVLEEQGMKVEIVKGATNKGFSDGQALIQILEVKGTASKDAIRAGKPVLQSFELNTYLEQAKAQNGAIVVDPTLTSDVKEQAYFWNNGAALPGKNWVIAIKPTTSWSLFTHEWAHKVDRIDRNNEFPEAVYSNQSPKSAGKLRALQRAGRSLEQSYISELNAAGAQFKLYFKSASGKPLDILSTIIYRAQNQRKVAIGRILQDPTNPGHYVLYLGSRVVFYGSYYAFYKTAGLVASEVSKAYLAHKLLQHQGEWTSLRCEEVSNNCKSLESCSANHQEDAFKQCTDVNEEIRSLRKEKN
jgi:hypothetical protein